MPRNAEHNALARQWELLKILPKRQPGITAKEVQEKLNNGGFEVQKKTVERDLLNLTGVFPIVCNNKGRPYGWHWMLNASIDIPGITLAEALSIRLVKDLLKSLLPSTLLNSLQPHFNQAKNKLTAMQANNAVANWQDKVRHVPPSLPMLPPSIDAAVLETVQQALLHDQQIEVEYQSAHEEKPSKRTLHPLALVQRSPVTYLVASAFNYQEARLYALHRIHDAVNIGQPANRPENFDLDAYIASGALQFGDGHNFVLKIAIWEGLAHILQETRLSEDQQIEQQEGSFILTATVVDSWQLRWWILSQADGVEVLEPAILREEIAGNLKVAAEQYI